MTKFKIGVVQIVTMLVSLLLVVVGLSSLPTLPQLQSVDYGVDTLRNYYYFASSNFDFFWDESNNVLTIQNSSGDLLSLRSGNSSSDLDPLLQLWSRTELSDGQVLLVPPVNCKLFYVSVPVQDVQSMADSWSQVGCMADKQIVTLYE